MDDGQEFDDGTAFSFGNWEALNCFRAGACGWRWCLTRGAEARSPVKDRTALDAVFDDVSAFYWRLLVRQGSGYGSHSEWEVFSS